MLVLAYRPFGALHPYAETGPIFLHASPCERYPETDVLPVMLLERSSVLLKGYDRNERIVYGTGQIVRPSEIGERAAAILARAEVAFVDIRSAANNCFTARIVRAPE